MKTSPTLSTDSFIRTSVWITGIGALVYLIVAIVGIRVYFHKEIQMQSETYQEVSALFGDLKNRQDQAARAAQIAADEAARAATVVDNAVKVSSKKQTALLKGQEVQADRQLLTYKLFVEIRDTCEKMLAECRGRK